MAISRKIYGHYFFNYFDVTIDITYLYDEQIKRLLHEIKEADAIVIGAGAGLSTSAGLTYSGKRFEKYFYDFAKRFGIRDMPRRTRR